MIDIHFHILSELDDGSRSLEESIDMARIAAADGITHMVATPHMFNGLSSNPEPVEILERVQIL
jgi:protein-tyrosine phosphatase